MFNVGDRCKFLSSDWASHREQHGWSEVTIVDPSSIRRGGTSGKASFGDGSREYWARPEFARGTADFAVVVCESELERVSSASSEPPSELDTFALLARTQRGGF